MKKRPLPVSGEQVPRRSWATLALLAWIFFAPRLFAQDETTSEAPRLRSFSLSGWHPPQLADPNSPGGFVPRPVDWDLVYELETREDWLGLPLEDWQDLFDRMIEQSPVGIPELEFGRDYRNLLAFGTDSQLEWTEKVLARLREQFLRTVDVRVTVLQLAPGETPKNTPNVLTREEAEGLRERLRVRFDQSERVLSGHLHAAIHERYSAFVRDYEVEVAREQVIVDPRTDIMSDGLRLWLIAEETFDERVHLDIQLEIGDRDDPITLRPTGAESLGVLQTPELRATWISFHAPISPGETLATWSIGPERHGPSFVVLLEASRTEPAPTNDNAAGGPFVDRIPLRSLQRPTQLGGQKIRADLRGWYQAEEYYEPSDPNQFADDFGDVLEQIADWTEGQVVEGNLVFLDREDATRARRMLQSTVESSLSRSSLRLTYAQPDCRMFLSLPIQSGGRVAMTHGVTSWTLPDYEVEIAENAAASNPSTVVVFDGLLFDAQIFESTDPNADPRAAIHAERHRLDPLRTVDLRATHLGKLFVNDQWLHRFDHRGALEDGVVSIESKLSSEDGPARLEVRVR
ncbi:MAG: hypothetical protein AAF196_10775 [Planctomycetota bacterium]